jgi:hypothetical protein
MSAWIVSNGHIDHIVTAAIAAGEAIRETPENRPFIKAAKGSADGCLVFADWCEEQGGVKLAAVLRRGHLPPTADELGQMLWRENLLSVAYRYPDDGDGDRPGPSDFRDADVDEYSYVPTKPLTAAALLKTIACYEYQSCEHPGWKISEARALTTRLMPARARERALDSNTPWGWDPRPKATCAQGRNRATI